jgi:hypothetical protein
MTDDTIGKSFTVIFTNGDLPNNPMSLRECAVCGGVFTHEQAREHRDVVCPPSAIQPLGIATRQR